MSFWRLYPAAAPTDSRWQDHAIWEVVVRAPSAAAARLVAAEIERDPDWPGVGNESLGFRSAFEDEKLYWASRLPAGDAAGFPQDGPAVIEKRRLYEPGTWRLLRG